MKRLIVIFSLIFSIATSFAQDNPLDRSNQTLQEFSEAQESFARGEASDGEQYYEGVLGEVLLVEYYLVSFVEMDEANLPVGDFNTAISDCLAQIKAAEKTLKIYEDEDWPMREDMQNVTLTWLGAVKGLMTDHLLALAEPLSRADETWGDEEFVLYEAYLKEYEEYLKADEAWVKFQYKYAEANGFVIEGTVDTDAWDGEATPTNSNEK